MNQISRSPIEYLFTIYPNWGEIGLKFFSKPCNVLTNSIHRGLKILVSGVQIPVLAYIQVTFSLQLSTRSEAIRVYLSTFGSIPVIPFGALPFGITHPTMIFLQIK